MSNLRNTDYRTGKFKVSLSNWPRLTKLDLEKTHFLEDCKLLQTFWKAVWQNWLKWAHLLTPDFQF